MNQAIRQVTALLEAEGIPYTLQTHPAVYTMEEMEALSLPRLEEVAKNLFLRDDKKRNYYLLVLHGEKSAHLKELRRRIGSRPLSFASEEDLHALLGLEKGSVTPFGILRDQGRRVQVLIDSAFQGGGIGVHPNVNTATLWLAAEDLVRVISGHGNPVSFLDLD